MLLTSRGVVAAAGAAQGLVVGPSLAGSTLVRADDPADLAEALDALVTDAARRGTAGRAARARAEQRLDWEPHIEAVQRAADDAAGAR